MNNIIQNLDNLDKELRIKQSIVDFSSVANKLRIKKELFNFPNKVLELLNGECNVSIETRAKVNNLLNLNSKLQGLQTKYVEAWFWFQNSGWELARNISDYTFEFNQEQISDLQELPWLIEQFYIDRIDLLNNNLEIQELFWVQDMDLVSKLELPLFTRLDMVMDVEWKLKLVEIEPIYAWIGETLGTRDVYNASNWIDSNFPGLLKSYLSALNRLEWKNVLFLPNPKLPGYFTEVEYLFSFLNKEKNKLKDLNLVFNEDSLNFREDGVYFEWNKIDVLMNYFIPKEQAEQSEFDDRIISEFKKWNIKLFPEPSLDLDSKLWLALAWNTKYFEDKTLYEKFIPKTIIYTDNIEINGDKMLKRISSNIEKKDFFDTSNWFDEKLILEDSKLWIIQDKIDTQIKEVVLLNRKWKIEKVNMYSRIEVYIFFTDNWAELWDVLVTMSPKQIVKWWRDCIMVPSTTKII